MVVTIKKWGWKYYQGTHHMLRIECILLEIDMIRSTMLCKVGRLTYDGWYIVHRKESEDKLYLEQWLGAWCTGLSVSQTWVQYSRWKLVLSIPSFFSSQQNILAYS